MPGREADTYFGKVQQCNVEGPWGVILQESGRQLWFREDSLMGEGDRLREGDQVEFEAVYHSDQQAWEAVRTHRIVAVASPQTNQSTSAVEGNSGEVASPEPHDEEPPPKPVATVSAQAEPNEVPTTEVHSALDGAEQAMGGLYTGTVMRFDREKGWGFIAREDGVEFFVHRRSIEGDGFRYLVQGEAVEFKVQHDERRGRDEAVSVRPPSYRQQGTVKKWDNAKGFGRIQPAGGGPDIFFHHTAILGRPKGGRTSAEEGELVEFEVEQEARGPVGMRVKRLDSRPPLLKFVNMGREDEWLEALATKAEQENWAYQHSPNPCSCPILRGYLIYTFARLKEESDAAEERDKKIRFGSDRGKQFACFNTGLVTPNQEQIYALFVEQNPERDGCDWRLDGFYAKSDRPMLGKFDRLPEMANYFDDPRELIYDRRHELVIDVDHIIGAPQLNVGGPRVLGA